MAEMIQQVPWWGWLILGIFIGCLLTLWVSTADNANIKDFYLQAIVDKDIQIENLEDANEALRKANNELGRK